MQLISNIPLGSNIFLIQENNSNRILLSYSLAEQAADLMPEAKSRLLDGITQLLKAEVLENKRRITNSVGVASIPNND